MQERSDSLDMTIRRKIHADNFPLFTLLTCSLLLFGAISAYFFARWSNQSNQENCKQTETMPLFEEFPVTRMTSEIVDI